MICRATGNFRIGGFVNSLLITVANTSFTYPFSDIETKRSSPFPEVTGRAPFLLDDIFRGTEAKRNKKKHRVGKIAKAWLLLMDFVVKSSS